MIYLFDLKLSEIEEILKNQMDPIMDENDTFKTLLLYSRNIDEDYNPNSLIHTIVNTFNEKFKKEDENISCTNLIAYNLIGNTVYTEFDHTMWKNFENRLPYVAALKDYLVTLNIINVAADGDHYYIGTSYNPQIIETGKIEFSTKFTYYIIDNSSSISELYVSEEIKTNVSKELNGVLIGGDKVYKIAQTGSGYKFITTENNIYSGLIGEIKKHSAVSNLHIEFDAESTIAMSTTKNGIIVGLNNGGRRV